MDKNYDFAGWVTKNDILCSDGVIIKHDAFSSNDQKKVPLVWEHVHNDPTNVLGYVMLHNQDSGVYGYGFFNDTEEAKHAKTLIEHGDVSSMSIAANKIKRHGRDVVHGRIFEVSLVLAGANPGALIDTVVAHSEEEDEEAVIYTGNLLHSATDVIDEKEASVPKEGNSMNESGQNEEKTIGDVLDSMNKEQKDVVHILVAQALDGKGSEKKESGDEEEMKHNVFSGEEANDVLTHSEQSEILNDAQRLGSLKDSYLEHGITNIEELFPDYKTTTQAPIIYKDQNTNTETIMSAISKSPFSRIKTRIADLTDDQARAKGYIKGKEKLEQVFPVLHRTTDPQTVYKKQKLDRDDIIDITDFDVVTFINSEMRMMLDEEIARAVLVGDGRAPSAEDKIQEAHIRPIISDDDMYTIKVSGVTVETLVEEVINALADYQGSGTPSMYIDPKLLAKFRLLKDNTGRYLFGDVPSTESMAARLGVSKIVPTSFMSGKGALIVNLSDYQLGATKGGEVTTFDDFDIDYNQYKYLIETRLSGALTAPKSAIAFSFTETPAPKPEG